MNLKHALLATAFVASAGLALSAGAATSPATSTFQVLMTINKSCSVSAGAASNINLGAVDAGAAVGTNGSSTINVTCSKTTPYKIGLQSTNNASTAGLGTMKGAIAGNTDTLTYQLNSNTQTGPVWGNVQGTNTVNGTGNGAAQPYTVWATVTAAAPTLVTPDSYADTVTVNVYF